jgi:hypothetical protein
MVVKRKIHIPNILPVTDYQMSEIHQKDFRTDQKYENNWIDSLYNERANIPILIHVNTCGNSSKLMHSGIQLWKFCIVFECACHKDNAETGWQPMIVMCVSWYYTDK